MIESYPSIQLPHETLGADADTFLIVRIADELYGLPGAALREVIRWRTPTVLPGAPPVLLGIVGQRGVVLPVVDLRLALGLPAGAPDRATRLILVQHEGVELALVVDGVLDLAPLAELGQPPVAAERGRGALIAAVTRLQDRPLGVIDLAALIATVQDGLRNG
jgi:purine-binding chemotaxis protein CheW